MTRLPSDATARIRNEAGHTIDGMSVIRSLSVEDALRFGALRMGWWGLAVDATDRASVMLPKTDDTTNAWAFDRRIHPGGIALNAIFGSDIGHCDVPAVVPESHELVADGLLSAADYRAFVWENVVDLWGGTNPDFLAGTVVEDAARRHVRRRAEAQNAEG